MLNKVTLIGNLGADPDMRHTAGGTSVANIRLATADRRKGSDGEWTEHTEWHSVVLFGRQADVAKQYLRKGSKVCIEGRLQTRKWQDKDGNDRYRTEVVANNLIMLGGEPREQQPQRRMVGEEYTQAASDTLEDLPF